MYSGWEVPGMMASTIDSMSVVAQSLDNVKSITGDVTKPVVAWGGKEMKDTASGLKALAEVPEDAAKSLFKALLWFLIIIAIVYVLIIAFPYLMNFAKGGFGRLF